MTRSPCAVPCATIRTSSDSTEITTHWQKQGQRLWYDQQIINTEWFIILPSMQQGCGVEVWKKFHVASVKVSKDALTFTTLKTYHTLFISTQEDERSQFSAAICQQNDEK